MNSVPDLLTLADSYAAATGLAEGTVSGRVLNGGNRLEKLRAGQTDIGFRRLQEAVQWFSDHWPEGVEWPVDVPRPDPAKAEEAA